MQKKEKGITVILLVAIIVIVLFIGGIAVNILISDEGVIRKTKETVQINEEQESYLKTEKTEEEMKPNIENEN